MNGDLLALGVSDIGGLLRGQEEAVLDAVAAAYLLHRLGRSSLPPSTFLDLPDPKTRIIALTGFLDAEPQVAGIKWIASFPDNHGHGLPRASAVILLNSLETGRPIALLEGAQISAARTAASAALAASALTVAPRSLGLVGCGVINREILRYTLITCPTLERLVVFDAVTVAAAALVEDLAADPGTAHLAVTTASTIAELCGSAEVVSFATTAATPHVSGEVARAGCSTILHVSLRDLDPLALADLDNVVDDIEHVLRANTSLHLAEQQLGHRRFVRTTLADVIQGAPARVGDGPTVFSPFGLGVLDLAVAQMLVTHAAAAGQGVQLDGFL